MLNKVMLIGNVGQDPEVRYFEQNQNFQGNDPAEQPAPRQVSAKYVRFRLATSERYRDRNGEPHENTEWHNIIAWRKIADFVENYVRKGSQLYIEGRLRTRQWLDQNGMQRTRTEVVVDSLQLLGRRSDNQNSSYQNAQQQSGYQPYQQPRQTSSYPSSQQYAPSAAQPETSEQPVTDTPPEDDLPF